MPVINRNITRTILDSAETTQDTRTPAKDALTFELTAGSKFYVGYNRPFSTRHFHFSTLNATARTVSVKYWDGTQYSAVNDLIDQTLGFTRNGFVSWTNLQDWREHAQTPIDDQERLYWIEITVSGNLDAGTKLQSVLDLYCDEDLVRAYYPEMMADDRYLPPGRDDFVEQLQAAKDLVVLRLKQDKLIRNEGQIIDINEVAISAVHAFAWIVLNPIAKDDGEKEMRDAAYNDFIRELNRVNIDIDWDNTGIIEDEEKDVDVSFIARG
jgi:hypothetical protein